MKEKKILTGKAMVKEISILLVPALKSLKVILGEKKFEKRIKQAAKLLARGVKPVPEKKNIVKKAAKRKKNSPSSNKPKPTTVK